MRTTKKTKVMTVVHGQSEYCICSNIKSNLRIKHEIVAKDKGKSSIQITGLLYLLNNDSRFKSFNSFVRSFTDIEYHKKLLINFKLFIIMDVDDCTEKLKKDFISKDMFKNHWLYDYIVPIYNDKNLESVMDSCDITVQKKKDYIVIFPTNHGDLNMDKAKEFSQKLSKCKNTNMNEYVDYCISIAEENLIS